MHNRVTIRKLRLTINSHRPENWEKAKKVDQPGYFAQPPQIPDLCGQDPVSEKDFDHRKAGIRQQLSYFCSLLGLLGLSWLLQGRQFNPISPIGFVAATAAAILILILYRACSACFVKKDG
jgi:hypothetical protein